MKKYYLHDGKEQLGPFSMEELKQNSLTRDTLVWAEGMEDWKKAGEIEDLKAIFSATPPPLPKNSGEENKIDAKIPNQKKSPKKNVIIFSVLGLALIAVFTALYTKVKNDAINESLRIQRIQKIVEQDSLKKLELENQRIEEEKIRLAELDRINEVESKKQFVRNNLNQFFDKKATYNYMVLGGISDAMISFYNSSDYPIDVVVIRVSYIKDNGAVWTTNDVTLTNIAANGSAIERSIDTDRGTKLELEILSIHSKALNLCFNGIQQGFDPYFCN